MKLRSYATTAHEALGMLEDLIKLAVIEFRGEIGIRVGYVCAMAAAMILATIGLVFAGVLFLVFAWDTPYRVAVAIALMLVPVGVSGIITAVVIKRWRNDTWLPATRSETQEFYAWLKTKL